MKNLSDLKMISKHLNYTNYKLKKFGNRIKSLWWFELFSFLSKFAVFCFLFFKGTEMRISQILQKPLNTLYFNLTKEISKTKVLIRFNFLLIYFLKIMVLLIGKLVSKKISTSEKCLKSLTFENTDWKNKKLLNHQTSEMHN